MKEEWRDIKGYEDYQVSNLGRVKSFKFKKPRIMKLHQTVLRQVIIELYRYGESKNFLVSRLVAEAFVPNPEGKPVVVHLDNNPRNNCASNLCWMTQAESNLRLYDLGRKKSGEDRNGAKLTNEQARYAKENPEGLNTCQLARKFGVTSQSISAIQKGKNYRRVLENV